MFLWLWILTLMASTGNAAYICQIAIITRSLREVQSTPRRALEIPEAAVSLT
jgi:hypothetical protein